MDRIASLDDPRIAAYRNLRDRTLRGESIFVAEGRPLVERLLDSPYEAESVFVSDEHAESLAGRTGSAPLYVAAESVLRAVVGFPFHLGVLAVGRRRPLPSLEELLAGRDRSGRLRILVLPEVTKPENLGLALRSAAAFGLEAVLLGERTCDPFSRRALRLSMGCVFRVPLSRSSDIAADVRNLGEQFNCHRFAAVLDPAAEPLDGVCWPSRAAVVLGNETEGIRDRWLQLCDRRVTIPMQAGVDSLNLGVATGIFLHAMRR